MILRLSYIVATSCSSSAVAAWLSIDRPQSVAKIGGMHFLVDFRYLSSPITPMQPRQDQQASFICVVGDPPNAAHGIWRMGC